MERRTLNIELSHKGFTAMELIIVMMVLSILTATFVIKNPFSIQDYSSIAKDQLIADIQYVQMRTMGEGARYNILFTNGSRSYSIRDYNNIVLEQKNLPGDITVRNTTNLNSNTLVFDTLGEPITAVSTTNSTINIGSASTTYATTTVYAITGKVE